MNEIWLVTMITYDYNSIYFLGVGNSLQRSWNPLEEEVERLSEQERMKDSKALWLNSAGHIRTQETEP